MIPWASIARRDGIAHDRPRTPTRVVLQGHIPMRFAQAVDLAKVGRLRADRLGLLEIATKVGISLNTPRKALGKAARPEICRHQHPHFRGGRCFLSWAEHCSAKILHEPSKWNRTDTRVCPAEANTFSLYSALKKPRSDGNLSISQCRDTRARFVIDEIARGRRKY